MVKHTVVKCLIKLTAKILYANLYRGVIVKAWINNFPLGKYCQSHLGVFGILPGQQVQNWLDICHLMGKKLHEDFIASDLPRKKNNKQTPSALGFTLCIAAWRVLTDLAENTQLTRTRALF